MPLQVPVDDNDGGGGGGGGSDDPYIHTQMVASASWTINHNLGHLYDHVTVVDTAENVVVGDIVFVSTNSLTINFSAPFSGRAIIGG